MKTGKSQDKQCSIIVITQGKGQGRGNKDGVISHASRYSSQTEKKDRLE